MEEFTEVNKILVTRVYDYLLIKPPLKNSKLSRGSFFDKLVHLYYATLSHFSHNLTYWLYI